MFGQGQCHGGRVGLRQNLNWVQQPRLPALIHLQFTLSLGLFISAVLCLLVLAACISDLVYLKIRNMLRGLGMWAPPFLHQLTKSHCELVQLKGGSWVVVKFSDKLRPKFTHWLDPIWGNS